MQARNEAVTDAMPGHAKPRRAVALVRVPGQWRQLPASVYSPAPKDHVSQVLEVVLPDVPERHSW